VAKKQSDRWCHVTPLFLFAGIVEQGGLHCGTDLEKTGFPRRDSSRNDDNRPIAALDGCRAADCVLLFTSPMPPLLSDKIRGRTKHWKAYPHVVVHFPAAVCLAAAGRKVFGSGDNVGRSLGSGEAPDVRSYTSYIAVHRAGVEEVMIRADSLPGRTLAITHAACVECFSSEDQLIVTEHLRRTGVQLTVVLTEKSGYIAAQSQPPGSEFLQLTDDFYNAVWSGDKQRQAELMAELARRCFD
jgi:hypothetical protein